MYFFNYAEQLQKNDLKFLLILGEKKINKPNDSIECLGHLGIVAGMIKDLNIIELIDKRPRVYTY